MDSFQHVNNTVYFKYFEAGRLKYFDFIMSGVQADDPQGQLFDVNGWKSGSKIGPILASTECSFKFPTTYPDQLLVGTSIPIPVSESEKYEYNKSIKRKYRLDHVIWSLKHQRVVATGSGSCVTYDYSNQKVVDMPDILYNVITKIQMKNNCHMLEQINKETEIEDFY